MDTKEPEKRDARGADGPGDTPPDGRSAETKHCRCGHGRHHHMVSPVGKYTLMGWFWVTVMGVTTRPLRIDYRCRECGEVFDYTEDPAARDALA
jgi:hypothetical protein